MPCEKRKIDSNVVGLAYAQEECLTELPTTPVWYPLDPNEYTDFGGEITTIAREPINASRQRKKGVTTDLDASGGFGQDLTFSNLQRLMQGFMFADARERVSTNPISDNALKTITVVDFTASSNEIEVGSGEGANFVVGMILRSTGFVEAANNNDQMVITAITSDVLTVDATLATETFTTGSLEIVGFEIAADAASITYDGGTGSLSLNTTGTFAGLDINVGEWIYINGDAATEKFTNNGGYARVKTVGSTSLTLQEATWTPVTETLSGGEKVRIYLGKFLRNEKELNLVKERSYQLERTLGEDTNGTQSEYLIGAVANEFTVQIASADKVTCDLSFSAVTNETRDGATGIKAGNRDAGLITENAYNTSSDVYQMRLFKIDEDSQTPTSFFAYVENATLTINNNVSGIKAIGQLGSFANNVGDFDVGGELNVYFATVEAVQAVKENADVSFNMVLAKDNAGMIYDVPLLSLGGGRVTVAKDEPIMLPLENSGAENEDGYTLSITYFSYLPNAAMPVIL